MTAKTIEDGDIVILASGGPLMTAEPSTRHDGVIPVRWFVGEELKFDVFSAACLKIIAKYTPDA